MLKQESVDKLLGLLRSVEKTIEILESKNEREQSDDFTQLLPAYELKLKLIEKLSYR